MMTPRPPEERFWPKVSIARNGCWLWTGGVVGFGYGQFRTGGRGSARVLAHRWAYTHLVGPVPDGLSLDHLCRTPTCVNPDHLEPVTHRENVLRSAGITALNARKTHCHAGHPLLAVAGARRRHCKQCASDRYRARVAARAALQQQGRAA